MFASVTFSYPLFENKDEKDKSKYLHFKAKKSKSKRESQYVESFVHNYYDLAYSVWLEMGTPPQRVAVTIDTGSTAFWVSSPYNPRCITDTIPDLTKRSQDVNCKNTFNATYSETFEWLDDTFYVSYLGGASASGVWGVDNITIGDTEVKDMEFAVCNITGRNNGLLGLAINPNPTHETFTMRLKSAGLVNLASHSIYLDSTSENDARILFGAIDKNRFTGDLVVFPIANGNPSKKPTHMQITLNSLTGMNTTDSTEETLATGAAPAILDNGTSNSIIPTYLFDRIKEYAGIIYSDEHNSHVLKCEFGETHSLIFNFQGKDISVPFTEFMTTTPVSTGSEYCKFHIATWSGDNMLLGDNFLRSIYMVTDVENYEIAIADSNPNPSDEDDIQVLHNKIKGVSADASLMWTTGASLTVVEPTSISSTSATSTA